MRAVNGVDERGGGTLEMKMVDEREVGLGCTDLTTVFHHQFCGCTAAAVEIGRPILAPWRLHSASTPFTAE